MIDSFEKKLFDCSVARSQAIYQNRSTGTSLRSGAVPI